FRGHHIRWGAGPPEKAGHFLGNVRPGRSSPELHGVESNCTERAIFQKLVGTRADCARVDRVRARLPKCDGSAQLYLGFEDDADEKKTSGCPAESAIPRTQCNEFGHDDIRPKARRCPWPCATATHNDERH